jgi:hypothetical protein
MSQLPSPQQNLTPKVGKKPLPRWALLALILGVPAAVIAFCKLVGMGNVETTAFTILCIFGIGVTYFTR